MSVEDRQQRQPDPGLCGGGGDALGHLGDVGVEEAVAVVMQIVELADSGEAGFQHLDIELCRHRLDLLGAHRQREAVHHLSPGPEGIGARAAGLGQSRHAALEGVAVQVGHAGKKDRVPFVAGERGRVFLYGSDDAGIDRQAHICGPSVGKQGFRCKDRAHDVLQFRCADDNRSCVGS